MRTRMRAWRTRRSAPPADRAADPVLRYDPERAKYAESDFGATVPHILGIREHVPAAAPDAPAPRFTAFKIAAKQKVAQAFWTAWSAAAAEGK